jgi:hypothetical protein
MPLADHYNDLGMLAIGLIFVGFVLISHKKWEGLLPIACGIAIVFFRSTCYGENRGNRQIAEAQESPINAVD